MATRSNFIIRDTDKKTGNKVFYVSYCHSDGYLAHNGVLLDTLYNTHKLAMELAMLGDCSYLDVRLHPEPDAKRNFDPHSFNNRIPGTSVFYGRDRGDKLSAATRYSTLDEAVAVCDTGFIYYWDEGVWRLFADEDGRCDGLLNDLICNDPEAMKNDQWLRDRGFNEDWMQRGRPVEHYGEGLDEYRAGQGESVHIKLTPAARKRLEAAKANQRIERYSAEALF